MSTYQYFKSRFITFQNVSVDTAALFPMNVIWWWIDSVCVFFSSGLLKCTFKLYLVNLWQLAYLEPTQYSKWQDQNIPLAHLICFSTLYTCKVKVVTITPNKQSIAANGLWSYSGKTLWEAHAVNKEVWSYSYFSVIAKIHF